MRASDSVSIPFVAEITVNAAPAGRAASSAASTAR